MQNSESINLSKTNIIKIISRSTVVGFRISHVKSYALQQIRAQGISGPDSSNRILEWIGIRPGNKQALMQLKSVRIEQDSGWRRPFPRKRFRKTSGHPNSAGTPAVVANILVNQKLIRWTAHWSFPESTSFPQTSVFSNRCGSIQTTGICAPAEDGENLGPGGYNVMRGQEESLRSPQAG